MEKVTVMDHPLIQHKNFAIAVCNDRCKRISGVGRGDRHADGV